MSTTVSVAIEHTNPRFLRPGADKRSAEPCMVPVDVPVEQYVATTIEEDSYFFTEDYGTKCAECGHIWTPEDRKKIDDIAIELATELAEEEDEEEDDDLDFDEEEDDDDPDELWPGEEDDDDLDDEDDEEWR